MLLWFFGQEDPIDDQRDAFVESIRYLQPGQMYIVPHPHSGQKRYLTTSPYYMMTSGESNPCRLPASMPSASQVDDVLLSYHPS